MNIFEPITAGSPDRACVRNTGRVCLSSVLASGLLLAASHPAWAKSDTVPDWVRTAAAQSLPTYSPETRAVVLLDDTTYTVAADGRAVEHVRHVVKILRPQGRSEGVVHVGFDKDTKLLQMNVWSIGPDGHEYAVKEKEMVDRGLDGGGEEFNDDRFRVAQAPAADPGAVIAYEYEQRARPFLTEKTWYFQDTLPIRKESFTLELPAGYTYKTAWVHHPAQDAIDLEKQRWRWEMQDTPAIEIEHVPVRPSGEALAGRMTLHYTGPGLADSNDGTWKSIGIWYESLSKDRLAATPEIAAKAQELTAGKTDFYAEAEAIGRFVQQQVRYFAVEVGIGGYQPHAAADIFRHRYGDCKDKATLTSAMLSTVGIHAALMMVDTHRGVVDRDVPSIVGNHMITAIEIPDGYTSPDLHSVVTASSGKRYLIFDPTSEKTPFGQLEHELQGGYGVLMNGPRTEALRLPLLDPALNTIRRQAEFQLQPDGVLKGTVTDSRFGDLSEFRRQMYTSGDAKEQREYLDRVLQQDFSSFTASDVQAENATALDKVFKLTYKVQADRYARTMGPLLMVRPRVLGDLGMALDHKERKIPIDLGETMQAKDEFTIDLPKGYVVDEVPDPVKVDLGFAAYESSVDVKGNTMHYTRTYTVREVSLPPDRYKDLQKLAGVIAADEESQAILKKQ